MTSGGGWRAQGHRLGRRVLRDLATIVTPDTILRWPRQLIARKWTRERRRMGRPGILKEIEQLTVPMANEHPRWGDTRIQGSQRNLEHWVARSTIAKILKGHGIEPAPDRPSSWADVLGRSLEHHRSGGLLHHRRVDAAW